MSYDSGDDAATAFRVRRWFEPQVSPLRFALLKNKLRLPDFEWVAQVSLLRPGFFLADGPKPEHPGLKSETWATHSTLVRAIFFFFLGGPVLLFERKMNE